LFLLSHAIFTYLNLLGYKNVVKNPNTLKI